MGEREQTVDDIVHRCINDFPNFPKISQVVDASTDDVVDGLLGLRLRAPAALVVVEARGLLEAPGGSGVRVRACVSS